MTDSVDKRERERERERTKKKEKLHEEASEIALTGWANAQQNRQCVARKQ